ncbi:MAG: phage integrase SAM-like domain-containing protein [Bacteroidaceae bacterium]
MAKIKVILDKRNNSDSKPVIVVVTRNSDRLRFNTGMTCEENEFNNGNITSKAKNCRLREIYTAIEYALIELDRTGELNKINNKKLKDIILFAAFRVKNNSLTLLYYLDRFIATKIKDSTKALYVGTKTKIEGFDKEADFDSVNKEWLLRFQSHLAEQGNRINTISIHLRNIRAVFNFAIDNEDTANYPFRRFSIKNEETEKRSLSTEDLRTLINYGCEEHQIFYRDIFMLSFFLCGINMIDLLHLKELRDGRVEYRRAKTNKLYSIKVEPEAQVIIDKYKGEDYLLKIMDRYSNYKDFCNRMNKNLREIGKMEIKGQGGKKVREPLFPFLSSYWARHTWATIAAELDIPKETIAAGLGHEIGCSTTSIYIRFDREKVDRANRAIIDYVKGIER